MFIPRFLEEFLIKNGVSEMLSSMRRRTESNGRWKKEREAGDDPCPVERAGSAAQFSP